MGRAHVLTRPLQRSVIVGVATAATCVAACQASRPIAPSPTVTQVMVLYSGSARPNQTFSTMAYAVDCDGAYRQVTNSAVWGSSDTSIVSPVTAIGGIPRFQTHSAGTAFVTAVYDDTTGYLPVRVLPVPVSGTST